MDKYVIEGGVPLRGEVLVSGAKNAALPIMAAALLTTDACVIENVPLLRDVLTMAELLRYLGCRVEIDAEAHRVTMQAPEREGLKTEVPEELARKMRASFLVTGPILARAGRVLAPHPGGCSIGSRPVNVDIRAFAAMGARVEVSNGCYYFQAEKLRGQPIYLDYPSHTGTENVLLAASLAEGTTVVKHAALEPEVSDLAKMLRMMGAEIDGFGSPYLIVRGVKRLHGVRYVVMPDRIEAGTFAVASAITHGDVTVRNVIPDHMDPLTHKLEEAGAKVEVDGTDYRVKGNGQVNPVEVQALHFPGFPTDLQAVFATLLTQSDGTSFVHERVFDDRFQYATELQKLGAKIRVAGHTATIVGPTPLFGADVRALDLRCGAALILAGLSADGRTEISDVYHIDRGYEDVESKLQGLGAHVTRVRENGA